MAKILFVCTGNICRSPTAEGVLRGKLNKLGINGITTDSAATHAYHIGEPPDSRTIAAAKKRGYMLQDLRARKVEASDFYDFTHILALDHGHLKILKSMSPPESNAKIELFLEYAGVEEKEVPDPYYGGAKDFERVLELVENGADALIERLRAEYVTK